MTIPDYCEGVPITDLGGYTGRGVPQIFSVYVVTNVQDSAYDPEKLYDKHEHVYYDVNVTLPKYLKEITLSRPYEETRSVMEDGLLVGYTFTTRCYFTIDESNEYFYTKEGKVYDKKTDTLYDKEFVYQ